MTMEMPPVTRPLPFRMLMLSAALCLSGCTSLDIFSTDKIDYRSSATSIKPAGLEVPPDLTQLTRDSRYHQVHSGTVSAASFQANAAAASTTGNAPIVPVSTTPTGTVAAQSVGDLHMEHLGSERWLHTSLAPEQVWPQLQAFWKDRGFVIVKDDAATGVMETDWAENRAKLPLDVIRSTLGSALDALYSTGELDKFRTRVERSGNGTDIYITHRGMVEVYTSPQKDATRWQPRPADPQLEGELMSRLMLKMGAGAEVAKTALAVPDASVTAGTPSGDAARARILSSGSVNTLQVDDGFDRAWRRVGVALDRSGFTVEDRDRAQGVYYVRYIDPKFAGKEEPGFFSKLFSSKADEGTPERYRVAVKGEGERSTVSVQTSQGATATGEVGVKIAKALLDDLK